MASASEILTKHGFVHTDELVRAAGETGVPLHIAAAMVEKESSGGYNVYGNDGRGVYSSTDPLGERPVPNRVTATNYARFEQRVLAGAVSNGVGPTQITYPPYIRQAKEQGVRLWLPYENMRFGLKILAGHLRGLFDAAGIEQAGTLYNAGNLNNGINAYGRDLATKAAIWKTRLHQEAGTMRTALGWTSPSGSGSKRIGPHIAHPTNPRLLTMRNDATADLIAAVWWLTHTGNGNQSDMVYVSQLHTARDPGAQFGTGNSDHKAWVAMDQNWNVHTWEVATGSAAYDAHMASKALARQHAMFAAIEKRLAAGKTPVIRWCGRPWRTDMGWMAYARGHRDCMHWVIGTTNWSRINAAAASLRTWFKPPRTVGDVQKVQRAIGVEDDGVWGHGSVKAMYAWERKNGLTPTGLPGTVAFWRKVDQPKKPEPVDPWSKVSKAYVRQAQEMLADIRRPNGKPYYTGAIDGSPGKATRDATTAFQRDQKLTPDGMFGDGTRARAQQVLARQREEDRMEELAEKLADRRVFGVDAESTAAALSAWVPPAGKGVLLAARESADHIGAVGVRAWRPNDISVLICRRGGSLPDATRREIQRMRPAWLFAVGGSGAVSDETLLAALQAAGIQP